MPMVWAIIELIRALFRAPLKVGQGPVMGAGRVYRAPVVICPQAYMEAVRSAGFT